MDASILLGNEDDTRPGFGDGTFTAPIRYETFASPDNLSIADFNGDDINDIVVFDRDVTILLGVESSNNPGFGDGTFATPMKHSVGQKISGCMTSGDFNGDGILDLVVCKGDSFSFEVLLGNQDPTNPGFGNVTFGDPIGHGRSISARSIVSGDFNSDGFIDVAIANNRSTFTEVLVFLNNGDGTFAEDVQYDTDISINSMIVADFNNDGVIDIVTINTNANSASIL